MARPRGRGLSTHTLRDFFTGTNALRKRNGECPGRDVLSNGFFVVHPRGGDFPPFSSCSAAGETGSVFEQRHRLREVAKIVELIERSHETFRVDIVVLVDRKVLKAYPT